MRAVIQRVSSASVTVDGETIGKIGHGLLVLLGVSKTDGAAQADLLVEKIVNLRILDDAEGKMNLSLLDTGGELLVVSQFTLYADTRRGRRPSFIDAAPPADAERLYSYFIERAKMTVRRVETGRFRAMMDVALVNDGPVTIVIDTETLSK